MGSVAELSFLCVAALFLAVAWQVIAPVLHSRSGQSSKLEPVWTKESPPRRIGTVGTEKVRFAAC